MSDRLRIIRDQINVGDDVLVTGHGHGAPRPARVCEVMRGAVRVVYSDRSTQPRVVAFKNVCRAEPIEPEVTAPPPIKRSTQPPAPIEAAPPRVDPPPTSSPNDDVQTWLEMGRDLIAKIDAELEGLRVHEADLRADAEALEDEADAYAKRAVDLAQRLETLRSITKP